MMSCRGLYTFKNKSPCDILWKTQTLVPWEMLGEFHLSFKGFMETKLRGHFAKPSGPCPISADTSLNTYLYRTLITWPWICWFIQSAPFTAVTTLLVSRSPSLGHSKNVLHESSINECEALYLLPEARIKRPCPQLIHSEDEADMRHAQDHQTLKENCVASVQLETSEEASV